MLIFKCSITYARMYSAEIILASNYDLLAKNFVLGEMSFLWSVLYSVF